jgi:hypothetical protein
MVEVLHTQKNHQNFSVLSNRAMALLREHAKEEFLPLARNKKRDGVLSIVVRNYICAETDERHRRDAGATKG